MENTTNTPTLTTSSYLDRVCERYPVLAQTERHLERTTDKFSFVSTRNVLEVLADNNWLPSAVQQTNTKKYQGYQKHIVRLQNRYYGQSYALNVARPELVLVNAHLGTSKFLLCAGYHVFACLNGLITGDVLSTAKIMHKGLNSESIEYAIKQVVERFSVLTSKLEEFNSIQLTEQEQNAYAKAAIELRFSESDNVWSVEPKTVLIPRRYSDSKVPTLWNTFNVVQENLIKGGFRATTSDNKRKRTKAIHQIDKNLSINRGLWVLTEELAKIKAEQR